MPSYHYLLNEGWIVNTDFQPTRSPRSEDECVHGALHDRYEVPAPALRGPAPAARGEVQRGQGHGDMHQVQYSTVQYSTIQRQVLTLLGVDIGGLVSIDSEAY